MDKDVNDLDIIPGAIDLDLDDADLDVDADDDLDFTFSKPDDKPDKPDNDDDDEPNTDDEPDETSDDDDDPSNDDSPDDADDADEEEYVDFSEWIKEFEGVPEDIKSEEDLVKALLDSKRKSSESEAKLKQFEQLTALLQANGMNGVSDLLNAKRNESVSKTDKPEPFFGNKPFSSHINKLIDSGVIPADSKAWWTNLAAINDAVMAPILQKIESTYTTAYEGLVGVQSQVGEFAWNGFDHKLKSQVDRKELEAVMRQHGVRDYNKGIMLYAIEHKPDLLQSLLKDAHESGFKKGHKKLRKSKAIPARKKTGGGGDTGSKVNFKKFLSYDGRLDEGKLSKLKLDDQIAIGEAYLAYQRKQLR